MKLTMGQEKKLSSLDNRARLVTKSNTNIVKSIMGKHTVLLVPKCLDGNACKTFNEYFEFNHHNKSTRNNDVLLKVPRVKLEMAKASFFFMGVKYYNSLPLEIRKSQLDFRDRVNDFLKTNSQATPFHFACAKFLNPVMNF